VLSIDAAARSALAEPGVVCDSLSAAAAGHGLVFGPDPATHSRCTLGGMIGNNSCGAHSVMAGKTVENIEALEVATYDGARFWCGPTDDAQFETILARNDRQTAPAFRRSSAASRATTSTSSCPRTASTSRARWWARKAPAPSRSRRRPRW
jgi:FAD/FMN-containing dehydrogenase